MLMQLKKELPRHGVALDPRQFGEEIAETFKLNCPAWTLDELLCHPDEAKKLCRYARKRFGRGLSDNMVLRTLLKLRKAGMLT